MKSVFKKALVVLMASLFVTGVYAAALTPMDKDDHAAMPAEAKPMHVMECHVCHMEHGKKMCHEVSCKKHCKKMHHHKKMHHKMHHKKKMMESANAETTTNNETGTAS